MEKKTKTVIDIAVFIIPAVIAFFTYKFGDTFSRIGYAIAIGLVFTIASAGIINAFDSDYKANSDVVDKITSLLATLVFPILFFVFSNYYKNNHDANRCVRAWASLLAACVIFFIIRLLIKFIVKMFKK